MKRTAPSLLKGAYGVLLRSAHTSLLSAAFVVWLIALLFPFYGETPGHTFNQTGYC